MKRLILLGFTLAITVLVALSTNLKSSKMGKIAGMVCDAKTGQGIPGAVVVIDSTTMGALADPTGHYQIVNVPPGMYALTAKIIGYRALTVTALSVLENQTTIQDFNLEASSIELKGQVVQAQRDLLKLSEAQTMRELTATDLANMPRTNCGGVSQSPSYYPGTQCPKPVVPPQYWPPANGGTNIPNGQPYDATFFKNYGTNPFVSTEDDHLSTFAVDCDKAAYTVMRSYLERGNLPPSDAVRVEEFVNNFDYHYNHPQDKAFCVSLEGGPSKFGDNYQLLKIGIIGKKIETKNRKDANLTFVIDVSGSMERENRLALVRRSLRMLVDNLTERDRVGIVVFGTNARVLLDPTSIFERDKIISAIESLYPEGSTNTEEGIRLGYEMANRCFEMRKINRVILCSDGVANVGNTDADDIFREIKGYADKGITLSTIGFGMENYNDVLMEKLGDKGNGHYSYVDNWDEAKRVFLENLTGTLQVIARDVKIQVDFNPNTVDRYRLLGYENRDVADNKFRDDKEDGGEIGSGHVVTALYEIRMKSESSGNIGTVFVRYKDPDSYAVGEVAQRIEREIFGTSFNRASSDFRLAAAAAEFAEILRDSYWAKGSQLSDVLSLAQGVVRDDPSAQVNELVDLISKADKIKRNVHNDDEPLGMNR